MDHKTEDYEGEQSLMGDFRKLEVWQQARALTKLAYQATKGFPAAERFGLTAQIRGAAVSIMANIAEGCGRNGKAEFIRFLSIASGSATELECHFIVANDQEYLKETFGASCSNELHVSSGCWRD